MCRSIDRFDTDPGGQDTFYNGHSLPFDFACFEKFKKFKKSLEKRFETIFKKIYLNIFTKLLEFALSYFKCSISFFFHDEIINIGQSFHCNT